MITLATAKHTSRELIYKISIGRVILNNEATNWLLHNICRYDPKGVISDIM